MVHSFDLVLVSAGIELEPAFRAVGIGVEQAVVEWPPCVVCAPDVLRLGPFSFGWPFARHRGGSDPVRQGFGTFRRILAWPADFRRDQTRKTAALPPSLQRPRTGPPGPNLGANTRVPYYLGNAGAIPRQFLVQSERRRPSTPRTRLRGDSWEHTRDGYPREVPAGWVRPASMCVRICLSKFV